MGEKRKKLPKIVDAAITEDGCLLVELNLKVYSHTSKALFTPEAILALIEEYAEIPPKEFNDFPGVPVVDAEFIFDDDPPDKNGQEKKTGPDEKEENGEVDPEEEIDLSSKSGEKEEE
ncbi:MAG: hypothetical protein ACREDF_06710 [Thermoplasmata archaeon]